MTDHCHAPEPLTREDCLDAAYEFLQAAAEHTDGGRIAEAQTFNALAATAIALAERTMPPVIGPVH